MGVLNVTPDSFFDGGRFSTVAAANAHATRLSDEGADIIDIGGESSRPGAEAVPDAEQIARVEPVVRAVVAQERALVSVDTTSPRVANRMLGLGAQAINDVSCLADAELARVAARHQAALIIMHTRGGLGTMQGYSQYPDDAYQDVVADTIRELSEARARAVDAGMPADDVLLDPGFGFAKNALHCFELLRRFGELQSLGARIVVGPSRKSFISAVSESPPEGRLGGTIAACLVCARRGASILRVHDVHEVRQALAVATAAERSGTELEATHA